MLGLRAFRILADMGERFVTESIQHPDKAFELTLRPPDFVSYIGQAKVKERLELAVEAARRRSEPVGHILLSGPPGLGKTTLAHIIARMMGWQAKPSGKLALRVQVGRFAACKLGKIWELWYNIAKELW